MVYAACGIDVTAAPGFRHAGRSLFSEAIGAPAMQPTPLYAECVQRAAALAGGPGALGARLGVPAPLVERWASGRSPVPQHVFLRVVDILLESGVPGPPAGAHPAKPPPP